jgi:hypothetical protein
MQKLWSQKSDKLGQTDWMQIVCGVDN